jgi:hypothetical protein
MTRADLALQGREFHMILTGGTLRAILEGWAFDIP